jgi:hypothetical protein
MQAWKRFRGLGGNQRRVVLEAALALTTSRLALRLAGFRRSSAFLARAAPLPAGPPAQVSPNIGSSALPPDEIARLTHATARYLPFSSNCLDRSLALCWLLRRRSVPARLRIGARKEGTRLEAHAWVEWNGIPLDDAGAPHRHYVPFDGAVASFEGGAG